MNKLDHVHSYQKICFSGAVFASKGYPFKNISGAVFASKGYPFKNISGAVFASKGYPFKNIFWLKPACQTVACSKFCYHIF